MKLCCEGQNQLGNDDNQCWVMKEDARKQWTNGSEQARGCLFALTHLEQHPGKGGGGGTSDGDGSAPCDCKHG